MASRVHLASAMATLMLAILSGCMAVLDDFLRIVFKRLEEADSCA